MSLILLSHAEQVAAHLRNELLRGRWRNVLPGIRQLGIEMGVNHNTVEAALRLLEEEGILASQGHGRPRRVNAHAASGQKRSLRVKILLYDADDRWLPDNVELLARLQEAGHAADYAPKSLQELGMKVGVWRVFWTNVRPMPGWSARDRAWFSRGSRPARCRLSRCMVDL